MNDQGRDCNSIARLLRRTAIAHWSGRILNSLSVPQKTGRKETYEGEDNSPQPGYTDLPRAKRGELEILVLLLY